jgi:hypothetical protein
LNEGIRRNRNSKIQRLRISNNERGLGKTAIEEKEEERQEISR